MWWCEFPSHMSGVISTRSVINGHGGNITPGKQAIFEVRQRHRDRRDLLLLFASYWDNANPNAGRPDLVQSQMGHACEWET
jgi:creatinine amidohydrolase